MTSTVLDALLGSRIRRGTHETSLPTEGLLETGIPDLDAFIGGLPRGRTCEILGPASAGKTTLLLSLLRQAMSPGATARDGDAAPRSRAGGACGSPEEEVRAGGSRAVALVDLSRTVFPGGRWAQGRLLVVRPKSAELGLRALDVLLSSASFEIIALVGSLPRGLPEALRVRVARLCREAGTSVVACGEHPVFSSCCALRLELDPLPDGVVVARVTKNRQGPLGERRLLLRHFPRLRVDAQVSPLRLVGQEVA